jgi:hypothetical protein
LVQAAEQLAEDSESPPKAWETYVGLLDFAISPNAESLAKSLEAFSRIEESNSLNRQYGITSWPLASLLMRASDSAELVEFARAAREGRFGDHDDWAVAEQRWADGLSLSDLVARAEGEWPFDATIRDRGFPVQAAGISSGLDWLPAARVLLKVLADREDHPTRRYLVGASFWLLAHFTSADQRIESAEILAAIRPSDFDDSAGVHLESLNAVSWNDPLTTPEVELLESIGIVQLPPRGISVPFLGERVVDLLVATWRAKPSPGIYRLIAISLPAGEWESEDTEDLLDPEDFDPAARAMLRLKLGATLEEADFSGLAKSDHHGWIKLLIDVLGTTRLELAARNAAQTYELLSAWQQRQEMVQFAPELIARRSSGLADQTVWSSLGLFKRPDANPSE